MLSPTSGSLARGCCRCWCPAGSGWTTLCPSGCCWATRRPLPGRAETWSTPTPGWSTTCWSGCLQPRGPQPRGLRGERRARAGGHHRHIHQRRPCRAYSSGVPAPDPNAIRDRGSGPRLRSGLGGVGHRRSQDVDLRGLDDDAVVAPLARGVQHLARRGVVACSWPRHRCHLFVGQYGELRGDPRPNVHLPPLTPAGLRGGKLEERQAHENRLSLHHRKALGPASYLLEVSSVASRSRRAEASSEGATSTRTPSSCICGYCPAASSAEIAALTP